MKTGKTKNRIREGNPAVTVLLYVLVLLICIATVYPMYYVLILSISAPEYAAKMIDAYLELTFSESISTAICILDSFWSMYDTPVFLSV